MGAFRVAGAVVGVFPVFETSLVCMAVSAEASLRCFFEGGGERSARVEGSFSGDSSRALLRVHGLGIATNGFMRTGLALHEMISEYKKQWRV
jgi:hypothetical protein